MEVARASLAVEGVEAEEAIRVGRAVSGGSRGSGGDYTGEGCRGSGAREQERKQPRRLHSWRLRGWRQWQQQRL